MDLRTVVIEFDSVAGAIAAHDSPRLPGRPEHADRTSPYRVFEPARVPSAACAVRPETRLTFGSAQLQCRFTCS